jgi:hypothetical protein
MMVPYAQIFVGRNSHDAYGCHSDAEFSRTLEDNIRERGAMNLLISDNAKAEVSLKSQDICRTLFIQTWQSEHSLNTRTTGEEDGER